MPEHRILLITTGGTIQGHVALAKQDAEGVRDQKTYAETILSTRLYLKEKWRLDIDVKLEPLVDEDTGKPVNVDSSDILPKHWKGLCQHIRDNYDAYDSFIILHGTNTLGYTCSALSFSMANLGKPVVLTGSQIPNEMPGSDAMTNLANSIKVAAWPYAEVQVRGVVAVFGNRIITGTRVKKNTEFDYDAFRSFGTGSIGKIGRMIVYDKVTLANHITYLSKTGAYNIALNADDLKIYNDFDMRIVSLTEFPGMSPDTFVSLVKNHNTKGFIFRAFGAGDVSKHLRPALEFLREEEIPIVVTTQAPNGNANFQVNEPGQYLKKHGLAIPAYDMSIESQTTKLAWLLAQKRELKIKHADVVREMGLDLHGEMNIMLEQKQ